MTVPLGGFPPVGAEWTLLVLVLVIIAGPLVAERLGLPGIVGLILGGMIVGPSVLGLLEREGTVEGIGQIGILVLMFLAGAEVDLDEFARRRRASLLFGGLTFALPFAFGIVAALALDFDPAAAVLVGSLWASHTLITYPVVRERGIARNRAVTTAVGGTVLTDTMALLALAVVAGSTAGEEPARVLGALAIGLVALLLYCFAVLPRLTGWFFAGVGQRRTLRFLFLLAALASAALLSEEGGVEGIVGAFFAGLALNRFIPNRSVLMERFEFVGSAIFIPIFLISTGMLVDPAQFASGRTMVLACSFLAVVVVGKLAAAWLTGKLLAFGVAEVGVVFSLSINQAAATLAATLVGFELGLLDEEVVSAALLVVLVTLLIGAFAASRFAERVPPVFDGEERRLGNVVLVALRDPVLGARLAAIGARLARADGGVVLPLVVAAGGPDELAQRREALSAAVSAAQGVGAEVDPILRVDTSLTGALESAVAETEASLVLVRHASGHRARTFLLGSSEEEVLARSRVPVLVVAVGDEQGTSRVVLALERRDVTGATRPDTVLAARVAESLARAFRAQLLVLAPHESARALVGEDVEATVRRFAGSRRAALVATCLPGDLVVLPARAARPCVPSEIELAGRFSVAVAAAPRGRGESRNATLGALTGAGDGT